MTHQRTQVHIATTNDQVNEARALLKTLRDDLAYDGRYTAPIETWRSIAPDAPTQLTMYLAGDVEGEVESRLSAMNPAFDVSVEVWEDLNL